MLHIRTVSGERLVDVDLASFHATLPPEMSAVRALKQHLHGYVGCQGSGKGLSFSMLMVRRRMGRMMTTWF